MTAELAPPVTAPVATEKRVRRLALAMVAVAVVATSAALLGVGVRATWGGQAAVDEPQYLLTALSLWEDHNLDISDELAEQRWRAFFDGVLPVQTRMLPDGRQISPHDPLLSVMLAVPMGLGGHVAAKATLSLVAGATAALLVWIAVRRFAVPTALAAFGTAVLFASPPLAVYGQQVYPELPAAGAVLVAVAVLTGPMWRAGLIALPVAVTALPWLGVKFVPVAAALAMVGLLRLVRNGRHAAAAIQVVALGLAGLGYLAVHQMIWGGWTAYSSGDHFQRAGEFAVVGLTPDYVGRSLRLVGLFADRAFGLVPWQPLWLLAVPALAALLFARPRGWAALALPLLAGWGVATWLALTMHGFWWPGRQVVVVLPVAALALLWWLGRLVPRLAPYATLLGSVGVWHLAALLRDGFAGRITWVVDFEHVHDRLYSLVRGLFPDYQTQGPGFWPLHVGWAAALLALGFCGLRSARTRRLRSRPADPQRT